MTFDTATLAVKPVKSVAITGNTSTDMSLAVNGSGVCDVCLSGSNVCDVLPKTAL